MKGFVVVVVILILAALGVELVQGEETGVGQYW
jgi:hypothetical protein